MFPLKRVYTCSSYRIRSESTSVKGAYTFSSLEHLIVGFEFTSFRGFAIRNTRQINSPANHSVSGLSSLSSISSTIPNTSPITSVYGSVRRRFSTMNPSIKQNTRKRRKKKKNKSSSCSSSSPAPSLPDDNHRTSQDRKNSSREEDDEAETMSWLADAFSSTSIDQIASAYHEAGGDAYKATEILAVDRVDPGESPISGFKSSFCRRKQKRRAASTGIVSDVIGKGYSNSNLGSNSSWRSEGRGKLPYSAEDAEQFLCSMLGDGCDLGMGVVKDVLCEFYPTVLSKCVDSCTFESS